MNLGNILKRLGGAALKSIPGVGVAAEILGFINDVLPVKMTESSTGDEIAQAIQSLPTAEQYDILQAQFDMQVEEIKAHVEVTKALAEVDISGASTRPWIARLFAINSIILADLLVAGIVYAIVQNQIDMLKQIKQCWPVLLSLMGPFLALLRSYFGMRTKEKAQKYEAVSNVAPVQGLISNIVGKLIKD